MSQRIGGIIQLQANGVVLDAKGNFTYNLGLPLREAVVGHEVHGYKETAQVPFIEGELTDRGNLDRRALLTLDDATIHLKLANGKMVVLNKAWFAGDGTGNTEESNMAVRFEGKSAKEI